MEINENNGASVDATYTWPIHLGTFALNLKAADTKDRLHEREVRLASTFGQILDRECGDAKGLEGEDNRIPSRYPIEGRIGIAEVVNQYFTVQRNAEFAAKEGYFGSLIRFTTDLTGSVTPTFKVAPLPQEMLEAAGMSLSFVGLGMLVSTVGFALGITEETVSNAGAVLMIVFGAILLVPRFSAAFATATAGVATSADSQMDGLGPRGVSGQFVGGILLGAVWSPCIGPTLGGAISLASQGESLAWAGAIMVAFALGVSTIILALGYGAQSAIRGRQAAMRRFAHAARPAMGVGFIAVGLMILFKVHHMLEFWALENLPAWFTDLSVSI